MEDHLHHLFDHSSYQYHSHIALAGLHSVLKALSSVLVDFVEYLIRYLLLHLQIYSY